MQLCLLHLSPVLSEDLPEISDTATMTAIKHAIRIPVLEMSIFFLDFHQIGRRGSRSMDIGVRA